MSLYRWKVEYTFPDIKHGEKHILETQISNGEWSRVGVVTARYSKGLRRPPAGIAPPAPDDFHYYIDMAWSQKIVAPLVPFQYYELSEAKKALEILVCDSLGESGLFTKA